MNVSFTNDARGDESKDIAFKLFRRKPKAIVSFSNDILFEGILDIKNVFSPSYEAGWVDKTIEDIINDISARMSFGDSVNLNAGSKTLLSIVQPNWTNAQMLLYLADHMKSDSGESGFLVFCDIPGFQKTRLNFISLTSLLKQKEKFTYVGSVETDDPDFFPIQTCDMIDNFDLIAHLGVSKQVYGYFDFETGEYINRTINLEDVTFHGLSDFFSYDSQDNIEGLSQNYLGVTNAFVSDYDGLARGNYYKKLNSLEKMWISSHGNNQVSPGDIVKVVFPEGEQKGSTMLSYQYSGKWLVERVKHIFGSVYSTSLLLTRCGFDSDKDTTFVEV